MVQLSSMAIHLYNGKTLKFPSSTPVINILQSCASHLQISAYYFNRFVLQSDRLLMLPYRNHAATCTHKLYFSIIDKLPIEEVVHGDLSCFIYYFNQCKHLFLEHHLQFDNGSLIAPLHKDLFLTFIRLNGLSIKRPDIHRNLQIYKTIFNIDITSDEKSLISDLHSHGLQSCSPKFYMTSFLEQYIKMEDPKIKNFCVYQNVDVEIDQLKIVNAEISIDNSCIKIDNNFIRIQNMLQISSSKSFILDIFMSSGSCVKISMNCLLSFETFLTMLDHKIRLQNGDTASILKSLHDIPIDMCSLNNHEIYKFIKKPLLPFIDVSCKELKLTLEVYGKCPGWYGIIQKEHDLVKQSDGVFYLIIYCIENTICEKIICQSVGKYFFEESPHIQYTSLLALLNLCKLSLSKIGKSYPLTKHLSEELLMDIQDPEVSKIFVPHAALSVNESSTAQTWLAMVFKGKFKRLAEQRMVTYFAYKDQCFSEKAKKDFMTEISVLSKIQSENILHILGLCAFLNSSKIQFITEDIPFYTLSEHLKTEYIPTYSLLDLNSHSGESGDDGPMAFSLLFKYVRYIVAGLHFLHNNKIIHSLPAPQHILFDRVRNNLKLFDVGMFAKVFTSSLDPIQIIHNSEDYDVSVLRWMAYDCIINSENLNTTYHDRYCSIICCTYAFFIC